ncbi:ATP-dependent DNA helicase RecQ [Synechococcus sp. WH 5701]|uniref:DNA helicase RecQ n=1 Tax=Synechococcus sp. CCFWC 502 TaxID=2978474 RepID=UPI0000698D35|nr:DNA helicase RecQ [Synechococcus sp. CCFWC 502]EAQ74591.1 ATP-dependent DNA helicase RecQ [Synechococcus sp. WH 5701]WFN58558.1 DNA helicase RecQ [Synechococcus sp. CCFWC 502]
MQSSFGGSDPLRVLREVFGYDRFRGPQEEIVRHVIAGGSGLVLMPTGGGKSLCYQVPALCREGLAVVVSPLIALMDDQVLALRQAGVRAAALHSGLSSEAVSVLWRSLLRGELDLLYVSPERLLGGDLLERLQERPLALFAIDEAHCVSQWGHDFRPEYLQLEALAQRFPQVPRLALTATADPRTRGEIIERLALEQGRVFLASFDRPNIRYLLRPKQEAKEQLLAFLEEFRGEAGIVYARSRSRVDSFAALLQAAGHGAVGYHAGMDASQRSSALSRFRNDSGVVVVATIAFGMGIDKPDVRFVAHLDLPKSLEAYYQETGRAGRDGLPATAWMVHGPGDVPQLRRFIEDSEADAAQKRIEHGKLDALVGFTEAPGCRRQVLLAHLGETLAEPCGNCDRCLEPQVLEDRTVAAQKALSAVWRTGQRFGAAHLTDVLLGADTARVRSLGHHSLSVYGIGKELNREQWRTLLRQLTSQGWLEPVPEGRGGLRWGEEARVRSLLRGDLKLELPAAPPRQERRRAAAAAAAAEPEADASLMTALKDWRRAQAREQGVPPYVVFHDRTLAELAARRPVRLADLGQVSGIGAAKLDRYGEAVLAVIEGWQAQT